MNQFICYCFEYTEADIIQDVRENKGESSIQKRIEAEKGKGACQCEVKHPKKR